MTKRLIAALALGILVSSALSACTTTEEVVEEKDGKISFGKLQWIGGDRPTKVVAQRVNLEDAKEVAVDDLFLPSASSASLNLEGQQFNALALTGQGRIFGEIQELHPLAGKAARVGLLADGSLEIFKSGQSDAEGNGIRRAIGGTAMGNDFIWFESNLSEETDVPWKIFAAGEEHAPRLLSRSEGNVEFSSFDYNYDALSPIVSDGFVYWQSEFANEWEEEHRGILRTPINGGGAAEEVASYAYWPTALSDGLASVRDTTVEGGAEPSPWQRQIVISSWPQEQVQEQQVILIEKESSDLGVSSFNEMTGSGDVLMTDYADNLLILNTATSEMFAVQNPADQYPQAQQICGNYATWSMNQEGYSGAGAQYFLHLKTKELSMIPDDNLNGQTLCEGDYFAWQKKDSLDPKAQPYVEVMKWKSEAAG